MEPRAHSTPNTERIASNAPVPANVTYCNQCNQKATVTVTITNKAKRGKATLIDTRKQLKKVDTHNWVYCRKHSTNIYHQMQHSVYAKKCNQNSVSRTIPDKYCIAATKTQSITNKSANIVQPNYATQLCEQKATKPQKPKKQKQTKKPAQKCKRDQILG